MTQLLSETKTATVARKPRLGFVGLGWIGRHRMQAMLRADAAEAAALLDPHPEALTSAAADAPDAARVSTYEQLLEQDLDGVVIATPSALHAAQAAAAFERGVAVFCQKPLARTAPEAASVINAAREADRLLGVDFSYRYVAAFRKVLDLAAAGELGEVHAVDLVFHNAYGPDKPWFRDPELSGGGCVIDLGVHLVDLALLALGYPRITAVQSSLYAGGTPLPPNPGVVEDYAVATLTTEAGATIRLACSWNLHAGQDAVIAADFYGSRAGGSVRNVKGSFYDFTAFSQRGTSRTVLCEPPDEWGGRAAVAWAQRLARDPSFDPEAERNAAVAQVLDRIYGR